MSRVMVIARKGMGKPSADDADTGQADAPVPHGGDASEGDDSDTASCPNCGCEFNDETGDVVKDGKPVKGGPVSGAYGKDGPDLPLPDVTPDKQAPAGENALATLLGPLLAGGH